MPGADLVGVAGLSDQVDNHDRIFSSALMFSLLAQQATQSAAKQ